MKWVDVCGPPGVGKSTVADPLWHSQLRFDDGRLPPASWAEWLDEVTRLFGLIRQHPTFEAAIRMNRRSVRKMATVARLRDPKAVELGADGEVKFWHGPYIQTGLVQRGLGFGWRLNQMGADVSEIVRYFELMPVSLGVAVLTAPLAEIEARNHARLANPATAHEDRAFMVPLMQKPLEIAIDTLGKRGTAVICLDTNDRPPESIRATLIQFAADSAIIAPPDGYRDQDTVLHAPPWWG